MAPLAPGAGRAAWASGSDAPEKKDVRIGFMPLTDCASVVMAAHKGFDAKHGIRITPTREASWAGVRDKLVSGRIDAAHALYGLVYGIQLGIGGPRQDMACLMTLNNNGQAITLSSQLRRRGVTDGASLARLVAGGGREHVFAQTFPTGTHAMWLYYWLGAHGIDPLADVRSVTVPPAQMVPTMRSGGVDGCCVGEPWNARAIAEAVGFTATTTQDIWPDHPEKVLGATADFVRRHPNTARAVVAAVLEAARWIDGSPAHREEAARVIAQEPYVNTDPHAILGRMLGRYEDGLGRQWTDAHPMRFFADGAVSFPYLSDGMWFMTQHRRWGLLREDPDYLAIARQVNQVGLYREAAALAGVDVPADPMRAARLFDGVVWNGRDPARYAAGFDVMAA